MLTERQAEYVEAMRVFWRLYGRAPSQRELADFIGVEHGAVHLMKIRLEKTGALKQVPAGELQSFTPADVKYTPMPGGFAVFWKGTE